MSLGLTLILDNPARHWEGMTSLLAVDTLTILPGDGLVSAMRQAWETRVADGTARPLELPLDLHSDDGIWRTTTDAWGKPLYTLRAGDVAAIRPDPDPAFPEWAGWNAAVLAMLAALDPQTPVILYWN